MILKLWAGAKVNNMCFRNNLIKVRTNTYDFFFLVQTKAFACAPALC